MMEKWQHGALDTTKYSLKAVLYYKDRLHLHKLHPMVPTLLHDHHDAPVGGHSGYHCTLQRIKSSFHWFGLHKSVKEYIKCCDTCQRNKSITQTPAGLLQPLPIPESIWTHVNMDFIEGLPTSHNKTTILVVIDRLSKYEHFIPLAQPYTALSVAKEFTANVVKLHGIPRVIVSDRDAIFTSAFWKELSRLQGVKLHMSSAYHPQSDGHAEGLNKCLETYLRCYCFQQQHSWFNWLHWAEYSYNTSVHSSMGITPFQAVYGISPPTLSPYVPDTSLIQEVGDSLLHRDQILKELKLHLIKAQDRMKRLAAPHRTDKEFDVGDLVCLKLQPYRQNSLVPRYSHKLSARFYGPSKITHRIGKAAYRLQLPEHSKIHPVFPISQLKRRHGDHPVQTFDLPTTLSVADKKPEALLGRRIIKRDNKAALQLLIHRKHQTPESATWEDY